MAIACLAPPGNEKAKKMVRQKQTSINFEKEKVFSMWNYHEGPWCAIVVQCDRNEVQLLSQTLGARAGEDDGLLLSPSAEHISSYEVLLMLIFHWSFFLSISSALAGESGGRRLPSAGQGWCKLLIDSSLSSLTYHHHHHHHEKKSKMLPKWNCNHRFKT